jgi:glycosyltransferase involved in cell wall biosynthesis
MKTPKISVIIPSLNKVKFITKTLDSIINQNYPNLEVIVQDGGSIDGTYKIIKEYEKKYPEVFKIESKNDGGQVNAINIGFKKAKGDLLTYINADDVYETGAFFSVIKEYQKHSEALWFVGRGKVINPSSEEIVKAVTSYKNLLLNLNSRFFLLVTNYLMQPSVFLTKKAYQKFGPFTGFSNGMVMEYCLWLRLSKISMPVVIKNTLSSFRITGDNISSISYKDLLKEDESIVRRFTKNIFIILLHKFNNLLRVAMIKAVN